MVGADSARLGAPKLELEEVIGKRAKFGGVGGKRGVGAVDELLDLRIIFREEGGTFSQPPLK